MGTAVQDAASISLVSDERLREGYRYWHRRSAGRLLPHRRDIDPIDIPHLLPHIRLVDVVAPGRFRYRLVGTEARLHHTADPVGRYLDEVLSPPAGPRIIALYDECVRERRPIYVEHAFILPDGSDVHRLSKVLYTPLTEDGLTVGQVLCFHVVSSTSSTLDAPIDMWAQSYRELVHTTL